MFHIHILRTHYDECDITREVFDLVFHIEHSNVVKTCCLIKTKFTERLIEKRIK